jgi:alpha-glucosidase
LTPKLFTSHVAQLNGFADTWPCVTFSNHDMSRPVTRYGGGDRDDALAKMLLVLLSAHRGTVLMYQGEELGLGDGHVSRAQVRDPFGDLYYPLFKGRDPCRTPMPWDGSKPHAGFSCAQPWLPVAPQHVAQAADRQHADKASVLNFTRALLSLRKRHPAWLRGAIAARALGEHVLALERAGEGERMVFLFNLSREPQAVDLGPWADWRGMDLPGAAAVDGGLPGCGFLARIAP